MCRCKACDAPLIGHPGWVELEDGTKIEEEYCSMCKVISRDADMIDTYECTLGNFTEVWSLIYPSGVTPATKIPYD